MGVEVVGIGNPVLDFVIQVEKLPEPDASSPVIQYSLQGGGKVATALAALSRLGARVGIIGMVGDDVQGEFIQKELQRDGVDITLLRIISGGRSPFSVVLADKSSKTRNIFWNSGSLGILEQLEAKEWEYLQQASCLLLAGASRTEIEAAKAVQSFGALTVYDADFFALEVRSILPYIDVCIASSDFASGYGGSPCVNLEDALRVAARIREEGPKIAIITMGKCGLAGYAGHEKIVLPAFDVPVEDTTGAGDVFHGAFIFGMLKGWEIYQTARFATATAALKTMWLGGRAALPTYEDVKAFMATGQPIVDRERIKLYEDTWHRLGRF
ncbi:PfkB family carbohydrate kinase [Moorellaceae bacterium AZ2]